MGGYSREDIIAAIQQATAHDGGKPVGRMRFETLTGITRRSWQGVYWTRWSDALRAAGWPVCSCPTTDYVCISQIPMTCFGRVTVGAGGGGLPTPPSATHYLRRSAVGVGVVVSVLTGWC